MIRAPGRRSHEALRGVTGNTFGARALEHATGMTTLAGNPDVRAIERESGTEVIEGLLGTHVHRNEKQHEKDGNCDAVINKLRRVPVPDTFA